MYKELIFLIIVSFLVVGCETVPQSGIVVTEDDIKQPHPFSNCRDSNYKIEKADYVIDGIITTKDTKKADEKKSSYDFIQYANLTIENILKGEQFNFYSIQLVSVTYHCIDDVCGATGAKIFQPHQRIRIYLKKNILGGLSILCNSLGIEEINGTRENPKLCSADSDCACGRNIKTGECFYGNKKYVDVEKQCPDFCTGIAGNLAVKCVDNECRQTLIQKSDGECSADFDCVADSCCHAKGCVSRNNAPDCKGILCTMVCMPGTLDCGEGRCACNNGVCEAILN